MNSNDKNETTLEELSDEELAQANGGTEVWNGKHKMPSSVADRPSIKGVEKSIKVDSLKSKGSIAAQNGDGGI